MRKLIRIMTIISFFSLIAYSAHAQSRLNLTGSGARASAMGYAFTGVADDATAISWNAAGLTQLMAPELSVIGRVSAGNVTTEGANFTIDRASDFNLNFASFVLPLSMGTSNLVVGGAYRNVFDFNNTTTYTSTETGEKATYEEKGGVWGISPSVAMQFIPNFSIGGTLNILTGSDESSWESNGQTSSNTGKTDYSGASIEIGTLAHFNRFSIGANFKLPYTLKIKKDDDETDLKIPMFFSVGAVFRPFDNLMLAFDYQARPWSKATFSSNREEGVSSGFEDANSIHLGGEFVISLGGLAIPLRAGLYTDPKPWKDDEGNKITGTMLTLGTGLAFGNLSLDASLEMGGSTYSSELWNGYDYTMAKTTDVDVRMTLGATLGL